MYRLRRIGKVFDPSVARPHSWMQEYAQCPVPFELDERTIRVFITSRGVRDANGMQISYPGYVDLDREDLSRVTAVAAEPILPLGRTGTFDEFGITPSSLVRVGADIFCYYTGWTRMRSIPYTMSIGLAISRDGGKTFQKIGEGPILSPTPSEPYLASGPIVKRAGGLWHMWYLSGKGWQMDGDKQVPLYQIAHAESDDGIHWRRDGLPILQPKSEDECQVSFALFRDGAIWKAVYAYRHGTNFRGQASGAYRLGLATSGDLLHWERQDQDLLIDPSVGEWDSEMMCYPQIGSFDDRRYLFYCGNHFGREGFGIAELLGP
nr:hypothetical protein [uncultured Roseateles sp.]